MTQTTANYAHALYDLATEASLCPEVGQQLELLTESFSQVPDFLRLLCAPNISKEERCEVIDSSFRGRVHPYVLNFLKLLTQRGYARSFADCCKIYNSRFNAEYGILPVRAVTAVPLSEAQHRRLTEKLEKITGKTVKLTNRVEPECIGGVRLDYNGKQVDATVKSRLESVGALLKNTGL